MLCRLGYVQRECRSRGVAHFQTASRLRSHCHRRYLSILIDEAHLRRSRRRWQRCRFARFAVAGIELIADRTSSNCTQRCARGLWYTEHICSTWRLLGRGASNDKGSLTQHALIVVHETVIELGQVVLPWLLLSDDKVKGKVKHLDIIKVLKIY